MMSRLKTLFGAKVETGKLDPATFAAKLARLRSIETPAFRTLDPPCVGVDEAANLWARERVLKRNPQASEEEIAGSLARMRGYGVLALLPPCDGLPVYNNAGYSEVDETSFRGAFLESCDDVLDNAELLQASQTMLPETLLAYGRTLRSKAFDFAAREGVSEVIGQRECGWQEASEPRAQAHIVDSLGRWAIFWGSRGHACCPKY